MRGGERGNLRWCDMLAFVDEEILLTDILNNRDLHPLCSLSIWLNISCFHDVLPENPRCDMHLAHFRNPACWSS